MINGVRCFLKDVVLLKSKQISPYTHPTMDFTSTMSLQKIYYNSKIVFGVSIGHNNNVYLAVVYLRLKLELTMAEVWVGELHYCPMYGSGWHVYIVSYLPPFLLDKISHEHTQNKHADLIMDLFKHKFHVFHWQEKDMALSVISQGNL